MKEIRRILKKWEKSGNENVRNSLNVFEGLMNFYEFLLCSKLFLTI